MIDFELDADLTLLQETARQFAVEQLIPNERNFEKERAVADSVRSSFAEIGLAGLELPESLGGAGLGAVARSVVLEELGAGDAGAALALDPIGPALYPLAELGGEAALREFAAPLLTRSGARAVLVRDVVPLLSESAGSVTGVLPWVPADHVDLLVVLEHERAYVLDAKLRCEALRGAGLRAAGASELHVEGAPILANWVSTPDTRRALARARLYVAALLVGVMRRAADFSREYAQERIAFGRPIAHHQALAFLIADMQTAVDSTRWLLREAAWRLDRNEDAFEVCASAYLEAVEQSQFVTPNAVQILGGHGFMQDYPVEKYMREARALCLMLGGVDAAREDACRDLDLVETPTELSARET